MTVALHTQNQDFSYDADGALVVSEDRIDAFVSEWKEELEWLADH